MNNSGAVLEKVATTPAQRIPHVAPDRAVSFLPSFKLLKAVVGDFIAPKRPNRNRPINSISQDAAIERQLQVATPSADALAELAKDNPPPAEYFDGEVERPW